MRSVKGMRIPRFACLVIVSGVAVSSLGAPAAREDGSEETFAGPATIAPIAVRVVVAESHSLEVWESSVGQLEAKIAPVIAAEVPGRLTAVKVDVGDRVEQNQLLAEIDDEAFRLARDMAKADMDRLNALIHARQREVKRFRALVQKNVADQSKLDDAEAQYNALVAQLAAADVRLQQAMRDIRKTRITSPIDGRVDATQVSKGDYVNVGSPMMRIVNLKWLKARLPYPETLLFRLHAGLPVRLSSPGMPDVEIESRISEVRPTITLGSRAAQVIVNIENPGGWEPGASVTGRVQVALHENAVLLPEISVVPRPAGFVVYVPTGHQVRQQTVTVGLRLGGKVEILSGIAPGEQVVSDGAGFLSDGAPIKLDAP